MKLLNRTLPGRCGVRKECLCTDETDWIETPTRVNKQMKCFWARDWSAEKLAEFCDETIEPHFARACAITCGNPTCADHESTHSIHLWGDTISTSCRQISNVNTTEYMNYMCPEKDYTKMYTHMNCVLLPVKVFLLFQVKFHLQHP